jgi:predicted Ser/Thr protein kinase
MTSYVKRFNNERPSYVRREAEFLQIAASHGLAPEVYDTDYKTYIEMEDLETMNVGDFYGEDIKHIPKHILAGMFSILWFLYHVCDIEYRDVWPRNFIVINDRVYIIDFGDARKKQKKCDSYLSKILKAGKITHWNPAFR